MDGEGSAAVRFEHLHESFKLQAEKAELLQSRIRILVSRALVLGKMMVR